MIDSIYHSRLLLVTALLLVILTIVLPASAQVENPQGLRLLTVMGNGEVRARPDIAEVRLGVETEAATATQARQENATRAGRVVNALKGLKIPDQAITTSTFQIYPIRRFPDERPQTGEPPIVGYRVTNIISVRTEQLDLVPRIIDDSVKAGANTVQSVDFMLRNQDAVQQEALKKAVANARQNAQTMAGELKINLGLLYNVQQGGLGVIPPPVFFRGMAAEAVSAPTPIFPGEITVNASITLTYIISQ